MIEIDLIRTKTMDNLEEEYPEAAPYIRKAVKEHSEEWVVDNYFPQIAQLGVIMDVPSVEELPFYDEEENETLTEPEKRKRAKVLSEYRKNLQTGTKPDTDSGSQ